jgi:hypothetical protein
VPTYATVFRAEPFTVTEAAAAGLSRGALRGLVRDDAVRRVVRGVYVDDHVPDSLDLRARALAKVVPAGVVVCLRTAGWLWGVDVLAMGADLRTPPIDLMAPAGSSAPRRRGVMGCTGPLTETDVVAIGGVLVTGLVRTAADCARLLPRPDALACLDAILAGPGVEKAAIEDALVPFAGHRGVIQGRELVALADGRSESPMESRTRLRAIDAGFPPFEPQVVVLDDGGEFVARLDLGRRAERKGLEYDGHEAHSGSRRAARDRLRHRRIESCGWDVAVVTGEQVLSRGLAFERGVAELLGCDYRLTRHHPRYGGWDRPALRPA